MPRDQRTPRQIMIGVSHSGAGFTKRQFNRGEAPPPTTGAHPIVKRAVKIAKPRSNRRVKVAQPPRVNIPSDYQIRELSLSVARQSAFRERRRQYLDNIAYRVSQGEEVSEDEKVGRLADFPKFYRLVAVKLRRYGGKHPIMIDIYLALKEYVHRARKEFRSLTLQDLKNFAELHIAGREALIIQMADEGELVQRPGSPKDAKKNGSSAYTEAAAKRRKDARRIDRITVRSRLPGSSEDLFITLGRSTKMVDGRRVPCSRRVFAIQTEAEWRAWQKSRIRDKQDYRNYHPRPRRDDRASDLN
ncbi:hypothetical protein HZC53_02120 [Candidatus Uhrbacteria bacterium]|nr:hypothetical protein [Candidatus Uhrbacteria bacterium]